MADVLVRTTAIQSQDRGFRLFFWTTATVGYFFLENSTGVLQYTKTEDAGLTWSSDIGVFAGGVARKYNAWADWETNGDTGSKIHITRISANAVGYVSLDTVDDALSTSVTVREVSGITGGSIYGKTGTVGDAIVDIVKARGGHLYIAFYNNDVSVDTFGFERSTDDGVTWVARTSTGFWEGEAERVILMPGNSDDSNDIMALFWDHQSQEIDRKLYDNSTDAWAVTLLSTGMNAFDSFVHNWAAVSRHSDDHVILAVANAGSLSSNDLRTFEVSSSAITALSTGIYSDEDKHVGVGLTIDQNTDNLYVFFGGDSDSVVLVHDQFRSLSTDGGSNWSTFDKINESTAEDFREVWPAMSVGGLKAGRISLTWPSENPNPDEVFFSNVNSIEILNSSGGTGDGPVMGDVGAGKIGAGIRVDWDNNGTFDADEELGGDVTSLRWTMGKDPEELNTPGGTLIIEVEDPEGDYVPGESATAFDSKFTSSDVSVGKDVTANLEYDGTSHAIFRGSIASITPFRFNGEQRATLFCVDEMDRFSEIELSVPLSSTSGTSGGATSSGMRPMGSLEGESVVLGGTTGLIAHILNDASFSSARALSEVGRSTMDNYWIYNVNVRDALFDIEKHERGIIFMSSSGDVTFLSSTHYTGLASSATFGPSTSLFTRMDYSMNSKDITNRVLATVHDRSSGFAELGIVGSLEPGAISLSQGSAVDIEVIFDKAPCRSITIPAVEKDSTQGISAVGAGGTSHVSNTTSGNHLSIFGQVKGASSVILTITNNATETVTFQQPETAEDSGTAFPISGIVMPNLGVESTAVATGSVDIFGRRNFNVDYPFFEGFSKGNDVAQNIVNNGSTADPTGIRLHMVGSDSNLVLQILSRAVGDVIAVNSTHFHLATNQEYYITGLEGEIAAGGPLQTVWTLQKST